LIRVTTWGARLGGIGPHAFRDSKGAILIRVRETISFMKTTREKNAAYLAEQLRARIPGVDLEVHAPSGKGNVWWIDAMFRGYSVAIEWSKEDGFGLSTPAEDDYGSAANEVYGDADEAVDRTVQLLKTGQRARARREMQLKADDGSPVAELESPV
jgi:hypothetical protein